MSPCRIISHLLLIFFLAIQARYDALASNNCKRIISLAPSSTEMLYHLELGENVIAVSSYDKYPKEVLDKPKVGGLLDSNYEGILSFKPTVVVLLKEHYDLSAKLNNLGISTLVLDHLSVEGIIDSIRIIGDFCKIDKYQAKIQELSNIVHGWEVKVKDKLLNLPRPKVLVLVASADQVGQEQSLYISGKDGFYASILKILSAEVLFDGLTQNLQQLSMEGLLALNADVLITILPNDEGVQLDPQNVSEDIKKLLPNLPAVKNSKTLTFNQDYMYIPGPRFIKVIEKFYSAIYE